MGKLTIFSRFSPVRVLPWAFYRHQLACLFIVGVAFWFISQHDSIDFWITRFWYQPDIHRFPLQNNYWLELINHKLLKFTIIGGAVCALFWGIYRGNGQLTVAMILLGLGTAVVGLLKANSIHSCPWSLTEFGGTATYLRLFESVPAGVNTGPGVCFPGGHASSGFSVMALFFLFYPLRPKAAWIYWSLGAALGLLMGFGQVVRGAHFFSHNLWSGWWIWLTQVLFYWLISYIVARYQRIH